MARDPAALFPHDYIFRATVFRLIPVWVKPNYVTMVRFALTPVVVFMLASGNLEVGLPLFLFAIFTDALDGSLARTRGQITPWGILFDPVADKLLMGLVALVIALRYYHPFLVAVAIFFDVLPLLAWLIRAKRQRAVMMANLWGKTKMVLQCLSFTLLFMGLLLRAPFVEDLGEVVFAVATVFGMIAAITYSL